MLGMKRLFAIVLLCVLVPFAYGETINYISGNTYIGEVWNGERHGHGTWTHRDGYKYDCVATALQEAYGLK
jgi:hypothetical protein